MSYWRVRRIAAGTYTPGTDWEPQFGDGVLTSYLCPSPTQNGELVAPVSGIGTCADLCLFSDSDFTASVYLELPSSGSVQLHVNGVRTEIAAAGAQSLSLIAGFNLIRLVSASGSLVMTGYLWGSDARSMWVSLYPDGSDPFSASTSTSVTSDSGGIGTLPLPH